MKNFMKEFPITVIEAKNGNITTKNVVLSTKGEVTSAQQRAGAINQYVRENFENHTCLCGDCDKGPLTCQKIADISKSLLSAYPFITDGFQIQDCYEDMNDALNALKFEDDSPELGEYEQETRINNSKIKAFIVTGCENYAYCKKYTIKY